MTIPCRNENLLYIQNKSCLESLLLMKKHPIHKKIHVIGVRARDCRTLQVRSHSHRFQLQQEGKNTPVQDFLESGTRWHCTQDSRTTWLISTLCPTISHTIVLKSRISNCQKNSYSLFLSKPLIRDEPTDFAGNRRRIKTSFRNSW